MDESSKPSKQTLSKKNTTRKRNKTKVALKGEATKVALKGEATKVALKGEATKVALKGEATKVALPSPENLSKLDTINKPAKAPTVAKADKKTRCPTGQRRNKEGECKEVIKKQKEVAELSVVGPIKAAKVELLLGDVIQLNDEEAMYYINYVDDHQMDVIDIGTSIPKTYRMEDEHFVPPGEIRSISLVYQNPLRGYVKQHHFAIHSWLSIHFRDDETVLNAKITDIQNDMIQIYSQVNDTYYFINFNYQGIPKTSNIDTIRLLAAPPTAPTYESAAPTDNVGPTESVVMPDYGRKITFDKDENLGQFALDVETDEADAELSVVGPITEQPISVADSEAIVFLGEFPVEIDKTSYNRFGIGTQVNDMLEAKLTKIPLAKRTTYAVNKIHKAITRYKQLREQVSMVDEDGVIYDVARKSHLTKPLVIFLEKYQNKLPWLYLVSKNVQKKLIDSKEWNENNEDPPEFPVELDNEYLAAMQNLQAQRPKNMWQELNLAFTPFYNTPQDRTIHDSLNALIENTDGSETPFGCAVQKYITGQVMVVKEKNSRVVREDVVMENDAISTHSLVTLPIHTLNYSRAVLPGTSILDRSQLTVHDNHGHWDYLLSLLSPKTQNSHLQTAFASIKSGNYYNDNLTVQKSQYVYDVKQIFDNAAIYYKSDAAQQANTTWSDYLQSVIPSNKAILRNLFQDKYNAAVLQLPYKLSIMNVMQALEPFLIYSDNVTADFMYYSQQSKQKEQTIQYEMEKQIQTYRRNLEKNQRFYESFHTLVNSRKNYSKHFTNSIAAAENIVGEIYTDFYANQSLKLVEQNKYLLFSENVKHILLDMNDRILQKSESVHMHQLKKNDKCAIEHYENTKEMQANKNIKPKKKGGANDDDDDAEDEKEEGAGAHGPVTDAKVELKFVLDTGGGPKKKKVEAAVENSPILANISLDVTDKEDEKEVDAAKLHDEISNFYTLKEKYDKSCMKGKTATCIYCNKKVGMMFKVTNDKKANTRTFQIVCSDKGKACTNTTIQTNYIYYTESVMTELRTNIKLIQGEIIILKNNALFGYDTVERIHANFQRLKKQLLEYLTQYINALQHVSNNCEHRAEVDESKKELNKYVALLNQEKNVAKIVSNYMDNIQPISEKIRRLTYNINELNVGTESGKPAKFTLHQKTCSDKMYEYNIFPTSARIRGVATTALATPIKKKPTATKAKTIKQPRVKKAVKS